MPITTRVFIEGSPHGTSACAYLPSWLVCAARDEADWVVEFGAWSYQWEDKKVGEYGFMDLGEIRELRRVVTESYAITSIQTGQTFALSFQYTTDKQESMRVIGREWGPEISVQHSPAKSLADAIVAFLRKGDTRPPSLKLTTGSHTTQQSSLPLSVSAKDDHGLRFISIGGRKYWPASPALEYQASREIPLTLGNNQITISTEDWCGNVAEEVITVTRVRGEPSTPPSFVAVPPPAPPPPPSGPDNGELDLSTGLPRSRQTRRDAFAIVIGCRDYQTPRIGRVEYAIQDAGLVRRYLQTTLGFKEENVILLNNATSADFRSWFGTSDVPTGKLAQYVRKGVTDLFIYYSGHGAPGFAGTTPSPYFVPVDCDPNEVALNGYPQQLLFKNVAALGAKSTVIVIDACFSGASESGMLIAGASPVPIAYGPTADLLVGNGAILVAASGTEVASWYPKAGHGLFTYFFLRALRGSADSNGDGTLTVGEVYQHVSDKSDGVPFWAPRLHSGWSQTSQLIGDRSIPLNR